MPVERFQIVFGDRADRLRPQSHAVAQRERGDLREHVLIVLPAFLPAGLRLVVDELLREGLVSPLPIDRIVVGPTLYPTPARKSVISVMAKHDLHETVSVVASEVPYRSG